MDKNEVVQKVSECVSAFVERRKTKLRDELSDTMSVNPFLLPILFDFHNANSFSDLSEFIVGSHLMTGHNTGFGKLIDEQILPKVFGTKKLGKKYREKNPPLLESHFNEIDHIVQQADGTTHLLSLKAGRWTIQLTMAMQLNRSFNEILNRYGERFDGITVGVFYGTYDGLTDKYDILRGINRGAQHDVVDLTDRVFVYAGRDFWAWLNNGIRETQDWVLEGIQAGVALSNPREETEKLLSIFNASVAQAYDQFIEEDGTVDWKALLTEING